MHTALVLCTLLFQSSWCGLNSLQSSGNLVCEVDLNRWLHAFEYKVDCVANENCSNDTVSFVERENALLGDDTEHLEYLDVIYLYLHAKVLVSYMYKNANDFPVWKAAKILQHLNCVSALYYLFRVRSCAASTRCRYSGSSPGMRVTGTGSTSMDMVLEIGVYCAILLTRCPSEFVQLLNLLKKSCCNVFRGLRDYLRFKGAYTWFSFRSKRMLVSMPSNGYSGILALQVFEERSSKSQEELVYEGYKKMAWALRQYRIKLCNLCRHFYGGKVSKLITRRAALFDRVKYNADCRVSVGDPSDFHAWSMAINRNICIVTHGMRKVLIFSKQSFPQLVPLVEFQPSDEDVVLLLKDNHFGSLVLKRRANVVPCNVETHEVSSISELMPYAFPTGGGDHDSDEERQGRRREQNRLAQQRRRHRLQEDGAAHAEHLASEQLRIQEYRDKQQADDAAYAEHLASDKHRKQEYREKQQADNVAYAEHLASDKHRKQNTRETLRADKKKYAKHLTHDRSRKRGSREKQKTTDSRAEAAHRNASHSVNAALRDFYNASTTFDKDRI